jgi:hypothetical protein
LYLTSTSGVCLSPQAPLVFPQKDYTCKKKPKKTLQSIRPRRQACNILYLVVVVRVWNCGFNQCECIFRGKRKTITNGASGRSEDGGGVTCFSASPAPPAGGERERESLSPGAKGPPPPARLPEGGIFGGCVSVARVPHPESSPQRDTSRVESERRGPAQVGGVGGALGHCHWAHGGAGPGGRGGRTFSPQNLTHSQRLFSLYYLMSLRETWTDKPQECLN